MRVDFKNVGNEMVEIWAATVGKFRINVTRTHANVHPFVFEMNEDANPYSDIVAKGFGPDVEETCRRAVIKARELSA